MNVFFHLVNASVAKNTQKNLLNCECFWEDSQNISSRDDSQNIVVEIGRPDNMLNRVKDTKQKHL